MNKPLVSIALCTFNGEIYLPQFLDSVLNQTYDHLEIVVCDDLSTDSTIHILEEYKLKSNFPFRITRNEKNLGFLRNFEKCIAACKGEYIATADQDDIWQEDKIEILIRSAGDNLLIYSDSELIDGNGSRLHIKMSDTANFVRGNDFRNFVLCNCCSGHAMLFKKELVKYAFPIPDHQEYHDWWLAYVAVMVGKIDFVSDVLVKYRMHLSNKSDVTGNLARHAANEKLRHKKWNKFNRINEVMNRMRSLSKISFNNNSQNIFFNDFLKAAENKLKYPISIRNFLFWKKHYDAVYYIEKKTGVKRLKFLFRELKGLFFKKWYYKLSGH